MRGALQFQFDIPERLKDPEFVSLPGAFYNWDLWASLQTRVSVSSSMKWGWFPLLPPPLSEAWGGVGEMPCVSGSGNSVALHMVQGQGVGGPHGLLELYRVWPVWLQPPRAGSSGLCGGFSRQGTGRAWQRELCVLLRPRAFGDGWVQE